MPIDSDNSINMADPLFDEQDVSAVSRVLRSGWISMGSEVEKFEAEIADYINGKHIVAFNNGTATLHAMLWVAGVRAGDEVIIPDITYMSTATAVLLIGAVPVLASHGDDWNISVETVESLLTSKTKAILSVDLKGLPVDYDALREFCNANGIAFLSDSAESFGAEYKNEKVGTQALAHSFSMFANKPLTCGEGGFVSTEDPAFAEGLKRFRNVGQVSRYLHQEFGSNYRMLDLIAALARSRLAKFDEMSISADAVNQKYVEYFLEMGSHGRDFHIQPIPSFCSRHARYAFALSFIENASRDAVASALQQKNIETRISFPPIHSQPVMKQFHYGCKPHVREQSMRYYQTNLDIPNHYALDDRSILAVVKTIEEILG